MVQKFGTLLDGHGPSWVHFVKLHVTQVHIPLRVRLGDIAEVLREVQVGRAGCLDRDLELTRLKIGRERVHLMGIDVFQVFGEDCDLPLFLQRLRGRKGLFGYLEVLIRRLNAHDEFVVCPERSEAGLHGSDLALRVLDDLLLEH